MAKQRTIYITQVYYNWESYANDGRGSHNTRSSIEYTFRGLPDDVLLSRYSDSVETVGRHEYHRLSPIVEAQS